MNHCSEISGSMRSPVAVAVADLVLVGPLAVQQLRSLNRRSITFCAGLAHGQSGELAGLGGHAAVEADRRDLGQAVAAADLEVVGVVRRA